MLGGWVDMGENAGAVWWRELPICFKQGDELVRASRFSLVLARGKVGQAVCREVGVSQRLALALLGWLTLRENDFY